MGQGRRGLERPVRPVGFSLRCCHEQPLLSLLGIPLLLYGVLLFCAANIRLSWGWGVGGGWLCGSYQALVGSIQYRKRFHIYTLGYSRPL